MMKLFTPVEMPASLPKLTYADGIMMLGSCFADRLGSRLVDAKFRCDVNPYGTLYNPLSISRALREILAEKRYSAQDLFFYNGCWHSGMHHGDFSSPQQAETLRLINERISQASQYLRSLIHLFITFGTAWVYEEGGRVVSNCHKRQESEFKRRCLEVGEIVDDYAELLSGMLVENADMEVTFTVSPIRHVRDGLHANQLSKSTLLLAVDELQTRLQSKRVHYFPAYEMMMDEWRDYRYYAADMVHPSPLAVDFIYELFENAFLSKEEQRLSALCREVRAALEHKPFHPEAEAYQSFMQQTIQKINEIKKLCPDIHLDKELSQCNTRLNK